MVKQPTPEELERMRRKADFYRKRDERISRIIVQRLAEQKNADRQRLQVA